MAVLLSGSLLGRVLSSATTARVPAFGVRDTWKSRIVQRLGDSVPIGGSEADALTLEDGCSGKRPDARDRWPMDLDALGLEAPDDEISSELRTLERDRAPLVGRHIRSGFVRRLAT